MVGAVTNLHRVSLSPPRLGNSLRRPGWRWSLLARVNTTPSVRFHDGVNIACSVKNAENLHGCCCHPVEEDVSLDDDAAETGTQLLAGAAHQRKLAEKSASVVDGCGKAFRCLG